MMIQQRLHLLREKMKEAGVAVYVVPSSDCHESEYVCAHYRAREYMTGFTGSAGTAVITLEEAGLWTDGRYFLQAGRQLQGSGIKLFRMGEPGVPGVEAYIREHLKMGECLGFDGRVMGASTALKLVKAAEDRGARVLVTRDLVGEIWPDRPGIPDAPVWILEDRWAGESAESKLSRVRKEMAEQGADVHVLASLCDIAWLLNIRGGDIPSVPVTLSFLMLTKEECVWYVRTSVVSEEIRAYLLKNGVSIRNYDHIYRDLESLAPGHAVWMDQKAVNYRLLSAVPKNVRLLDRQSPAEYMKAVKNETEISNLRTAHIKEGIAFTRLMRWLKTNVGKERITECSAASYLEERRREQEHYLGESFAPICAYGPNGAIVHYTATEETDTELKPEGFLLVDAGGHYLEGSTDTTRTFALGELSREQKKMFTAVCRGNLRLANAVFLHGISGYGLDVLCREPLWKLSADYKHGTGHGVGYLLSIHEGPNAFRWKLRAGEDPAVLEPGMVTTDEPGIYIEENYGIRTENELLCVEKEQNEYGQFLAFENLTLTPIDLDAILPEEMSEEERAYLNAYHRNVYEKLSPYLTGEERDWLGKYTRNI